MVLLRRIFIDIYSSIWNTEYMKKSKKYLNYDSYLPCGRIQKNFQRIQIYNLKIERFFFFQTPIYAYLTKIQRFFCIFRHYIYLWNK